MNLRLIVENFMKVGASSYTSADDTDDGLVRCPYLYPMPRLPKERPRPWCHPLRSRAMPSVCRLYN